MKPLISIIIATYNEEKFIANCVNSLLLQDFDKSFEILVVDGNSTDKTKEIISKIIKKNKNKKIQIKLFNNPKIKTPFAFNIGLKKSKADYFAILGAHSELDKNWLKLSYETLISSPSNVVAVGGKLDRVSNKNKLTQSIDYVTNTFFGGGTSTHRHSKKKQFVNTVVFGLYRKKLISKFRFDESFIIGQDAEFNLQLINKGFKLLFNPKIKSKYYVRNSLKKFKKQMYNYGVGRMKIIQKHGLSSLFHLLPLLFIIYVILMIPLSIFLHWIFILLFVLYLLILFFVSLGKINLFFINFSVLLMIYFCFGFGMLKQFLFWKRDCYD